MICQQSTTSGSPLLNRFSAVLSRPRYMVPKFCVCGFITTDATSGFCEMIQKSQIFRVILALLAITLVGAKRALIKNREVTYKAKLCTL